MSLDPMMIEIDDAMRAQQMKVLWEKYGQWLIGIVVIVILSTTIGVIWSKIQNNALTKQSNSLLTILQDEAETPNTVSELNTLYKDANVPLKAVVGLYRAQKLEQSGDLKATQAIYEDMMDQRRLPEVVQNLSRVHYVRLGIIQKQPASDLLKIIKPVTKDNSVSFYPSAMEMKGLLLKQQGKQDEANKVFKELADDSSVAGTIRQRAKALISYEKK